MNDARRWEFDLLEYLHGEGFLVPPADEHDHRELVASRPPAGEDDWHAVADELDRLHSATIGWPQRPGSRRARDLLTAGRGGDVDLVDLPASAAGLLRDALAPLPDGPDAVVHGDPGPHNVRLTPEGRVALLGWGGARVDCPWFDLAELPVRRLGSGEAAIAGAAAHAWATAAAWVGEPAYARWRLDLLDRYRKCRSHPSSRG